MVPSGNTKAKEEVFGSLPAQRLLCPMSEVHGVFSDRNLLPTFEGTPKAMTITYNVLRLFWITLTSNSEQGFMSLVSGLFFFFTWSLALRESIVSPDGTISFKLYMCVYILTYIH